jgi:hypothetical protein
MGKKGKKIFVKEKVYYYWNGKSWTAVDDTTGDNWIEDFGDEKDAIRWCQGKIEADEAKSHIPVTEGDVLKWLKSSP